MPARRRSSPRPGWLRAHLAKWPMLVYRLGLGTLLTPWVLLLTTRGRVTGQARRTPLWYVREGDVVYCISGWGTTSDWSRNLSKDSRALVQIGRRRWETRGLFVSSSGEREKVLRTLKRRYGPLVTLLYHMDRLTMVAFSLDTPEDGLDLGGETGGRVS